MSFHRYFRYLIPAFLLAMVFGACTANEPTVTPTTIPPTLTFSLPIPANEMLSKAMAAFEKAKTFQFTMELSAAVVGIPFGMKAQGMIEQPGKTYMSVSVIGRTFDVLVLSENEVYSRSSPEEVWKPADMDRINQPGMNSDVMAQMQIVDFVKSVTADGLEVIGGVDCYRLTFAVDTFLYYRTFDPAGARKAEEIKPITGLVWVGKDDGMLRKLEMDMPVSYQSIEISATLTIEFSAYNEPLEFPQP